MTPVQLRDTRSAFRTNEEFHVRQEEFAQYIHEFVNPARLAEGLEPINYTIAKEAFRILDKFFVHWRSNGITD